jgi:hypothetical protein
VHINTSECHKSCNQFSAEAEMAAKKYKISRHIWFLQKLSKMIAWKNWLIKKVKMAKGKKSKTQMTDNVIDKK